MMLQASRDPIVRHVRYSVPHWPAGARGQRLVLLTDAHMAGPDTPPRRLARIVATINRLQPDIVLLGGDFVSDKALATRRYDAAEAARPFAGLRARAGVFAVLGNHDHWEGPDAVERALMRAGVVVLDNDAVRIGDLAIGGVDDDYTHHADVAGVAARLKSLGGTPILLSHSPDVFPETPAWIGLVLAGHTHCGQISLPLIGPIFTASRYGRRFACGMIREGDHRMIVSAGIGTSMLPLRLNAPPDLWVIDVGA